MKNQPLSTRETAEILGVSVGRVRQFVYAGRLAPTRFGTDRWLFDAAAVAAFAKLPRNVGRKKKRRARK